MKKYLLYISVIFIQGCYYDVAEELYPGSGNKNCDTIPDVYNTKIAGILSNNCALSGCHVSSGGVAPNFSDSATIYANVDRIQVRAINDKTMPPSGPISSCDINALQNWINGGTK